MSIFAWADLRRRYLRARKWVPEDAFKQLKDTEDWRKENKIEELYDTIDVEDYDQARRLVCKQYASLWSSSLTSYSTHNGPVVETSAVFQHTSSRLHI